MSELASEGGAVDYDAILIVSFGGPEKPDDVVPFLQNVTRGKNIPTERLEQVGARYHLFGGRSPINDQCRDLISKLESELASRDISLPVYWGNRNWDPLLEDTLQQMTDDGVQRAIAFVTSATSSYSGCRQYRENIEVARAAVGPGAPVVHKIRQYYDHTGFIEPMIENTANALNKVDGDARLIFTAHSIPLSMATTSDYEAQLREAARLIAAGVGYDDWDLAWQSRSGPPAIPWLEPDINNHLRTLADRGTKAAVLVPVGFISDHMEVIYDLDTEALATADDLEMRLERASTVGSDPRFVSMIVELVEERRSGIPARNLGELAIRPDFCADDCCPAPQRRPSSTGNPTSPGRPD